MRTSISRLSTGSKVTTIIAALMLVGVIYLLFSPIYSVSNGGRTYCNSLLSGPSDDWQRGLCGADVRLTNLWRVIALALSSIVTFGLGLLLFRPESAPASAAVSAQVRDPEPEVEEESDEEAEEAAKAAEAKKKAARAKAARGRRASARAERSVEDDVWGD